MNETPTIPHIDFETPLPVFRVRGLEQEIVGTQLLITDTHEGKRLRIRLLDINPRTPTTYEILSDLPNAAKLAKFIAEETPQIQIYRKTEYCIATESPDGSLLILLTEKGRGFLEEEKNVEFLLGDTRGATLKLTTERILTSVPPPYATFQVEDNSIIWYHRNTVKVGASALRDELLKNGWAKMKKYRK